MRDDGDTEVFATPLADGSVAVGLFHRGGSVPAHGVAAYRVSGGSPPAATTSRLRGDASGRCVDVDNASTAAGATALLWDCHTAADQLWTTWAGGEIRVYGDKCLDASNQGTTNGTRVITWPCNGQNNRKRTPPGREDDRRAAAAALEEACRSVAERGTRALLVRLPGLRE